MAWKRWISGSVDQAKFRTLTTSPPQPLHFVWRLHFLTQLLRVFFNYFLKCSKVMCMLHKVKPLNWSSKLSIFERECEWLLIGGYWPVQGAPHLSSNICWDELQLTRKPNEDKSSKKKKRMWMDSWQSKVVNIIITQFTMLLWPLKYTWHSWQFTVIHYIFS